MKTIRVLEIGDVIRIRDNRNIEHLVFDEQWTFVGGDLQHRVTLRDITDIDAINMKLIDKSQCVTYFDYSKYNNEAAISYELVGKMEPVIWKRNERDWL